MEGISILNKDVNLRVNVCHRLGNNGVICFVNKNYVQRMIEYFDELRKSDKSISNFRDLINVIEIVRQRRLAKMRVLKKQENSGYILVSGITLSGIVALVAIIFMTINFILMG